MEPLAVYKGHTAIVEVSRRERWESEERKLMPDS